MAGEQPEDTLLEEEKGERDLEEIKSLDQFVKEVVKEKKKLWYLAGPAIFTSLAQYSLGATTQVFAGQLTTLELDAVSTENMIIAGLAFGIMVVQMGSRKFNEFVVLLCFLVAVLGLGIEVTARSTQELGAFSHIGTAGNLKAGRCGFLSRIFRRKKEYD